jgi:hypothetical protein
MTILDDRRAEVPMGVVAADVTVDDRGRNIETS